MHLKLKYLFIVHVVPERRPVLRADRVSVRLVQQLGVHVQHRRVVSHRPRMARPELLASRSQTK